MRESERLRYAVGQQVAALEELVASEDTPAHKAYGVKRGTRSLAELIARLVEAEDDEATG